MLLTESAAQRKLDGVSSGAGKSIENGAVLDAHEAVGHMLGQQLGGDREPALAVQQNALVEAGEEAKALVPVFHHLLGVELRKSIKSIIETISSSPGGVEKIKK
jgi:hypothetical protein